MKLTRKQKQMIERTNELSLQGLELIYSGVEKTDRRIVNIMKQVERNLDVLRSQKVDKHTFRNYSDEVNQTIKIKK